MKYFHPKKYWRLLKEKLERFFLYYLLPDKVYLKMKFKQVHGTELNLDNPQTIDEKLQWIKLNDRKPIYHTMIDKIASKSFIEQRLGTTEYTIPLLGTWEKYEDIDFSTLPNEFVLKCNHDSYSWIIVRDKSKLDHTAAKEKLSKALKVNYYHEENKQWGYDGIKPMIMAEHYLAGEKLEYQCFCNNGEPQFFLVRSDLGDSKGGFNVCYDLNWNRLDYRIDKYLNINLLPPPYLRRMIEISKVLAKDTLHLRVDFYGMENALYMGELTFYSNGGDFHNFSEEGKKALTETLVLPIENEN